ncbi:hypothetical protein FVE85_7216 [Porphyridium purpureum]|uniref:Uncharacterized protein n=1 Tax=Porphyridium purpureum TaxID=35688 RepID=A0A5J4Z6V8_PORPP|nr:hypothetical protein FVE85_7216 [Porphyridium purpureum]|eukprot:POR5381..scf295_1
MEREERKGCGTTFSRVPSAERGPGDVMMGAFPGERSMESEFLECIRNPELLQSAFALDWCVMTKAEMNSINVAAAAAAARKNLASSGVPPLDVDEYGEDVYEDEHDVDELMDDDDVDSAHGDGDSSCSMCRRCQLRRRLERKLAARKMLCMLDELDNRPDGPLDICDTGLSLADRRDGLGHLSGKGSGSMSLRRGNGAGQVEDDRSIDDLLSFIGEKPQGGKEKRKTKSKKRKNKSKSVSSNGHQEENRAAVQGDKTELGSAESAQHIIHAKNGKKKDTKKSCAGTNLATAAPERGYAADRSERLIVDIAKNVAEDEEDQDIDSSADCDATGATGLLESALESLLKMDQEIEDDIRFDDITPEEHAALDREVEEFRIRLESCRSCPG